MLLFGAFGGITTTIFFKIKKKVLLRTIEELKQSVLCGWLPLRRFRIFLFQSN